MATRAQQSELLLAGFRDPVTDDWLIGGTVEFYSAGTSNAKTAWEDKDKASAITSVTLDSAGQAQVYFDGVYKFVVKNSSGTIKYTLDNLKFRATATTVLTKTTDYTATVDDDVILCDTTAGPITIMLYPVVNAVASITIKNIGGSLNDVTVDGDGTELINGALTATLVDGAAQEYYSDLTQWFGAATTTGTTYTTSNLIGSASVIFTAASGITNLSVPGASNTTKGVIEIASDAEVATGTSEVLAINPLQLKTAVGVSPFTEEYISTAQTITTSGQLILAHGLSVEPKLVRYVLQCTTAEFNYSIGDRIVIDGSASRVNTPTIDATNITIRFSSVAGASFSAGDKTTGNLVNLTNTNWQLYVNAWS